ncbi:hypothetical protein BDQ17DRAFT_1360606 [Cyathus striatus]|nr:hypothetical protein BDQ17DRAFT_1360606 [Cyathus striatus]
MLSSIASLLPSALHINVPERDQRRVFAQDEDEDDEQKTQGEEDREREERETETTRKKSKKDKVNETFIIVRPPPSKSNHPLNLQVQLVPPNVKPPTGVNPTTPTTARASFESTTPTTADINDLTRSTSATSTATTATSASSYTSLRSSSTASFASISSSSTSRRTIIPLYNLQAHNVLTNVVVDAGTDAKIARFQKRGIEMMELAVIEPVEVWGDPSAKERQGSTDEMGVVHRTGTKDRIQDSAASSAISLTSTNHSHSHHPTPIPQQVSVPPPLPTIPQTPPPAVKRNIFGKFFKKNSSAKDVPSPPSSPSPSIAIFSSPQQLQTPQSPTPKRPVSMVPDVNVTPSPTTTNKGHGRNLSLTNGLPPLGGLNIRATLRNSKSRLTTALDGTSLSADLRGVPPSSPLAHTSTITEPQNTNTRRRSPSPNPSSVSLLSSTNSDPLQLAPTQTQMETIREKEREKEKQEKLQLRPPILGIQPTYVSSSTQPAPRGNVSLKGERALMYVWLVRRWLKRREGEEGGLLGALGAVHLSGVPGMLPLQGAVSGMGGVEVRFEWKRAKGKKGAITGDDKEKGGSTRSRRRGSTHRRSTVDEEDEDREREKREKKKNRLSAASFGTNVTSEEGGVEERDEGDESDPEDSETPWVCTLKIRRSAPVVAPSSRPSSSQGHGPVSQAPPQAQVLRVKVGTLSPTPHHPKVVAMLKVPFPLPDVEVERMGIVRRRGVGSALGSKMLAGIEALQSSQQEYGTPVPYHGTTLTAEEIKDIVCCTGLWLIVREGFGGVGRVSRKGDGWRIRG